MSTEPLLRVAPGMWLIRTQAAATLTQGIGSASRRVSVLVLATDPGGPAAGAGNPPVGVPGTWREIF